ncbi:MAG TPA: hypothetical protein VI981_01630 [Candidatus Paceibacterota bacterium]
MRVHGVSKIRELHKMRRKGHSIQDLMKLFSLSKSTVWHHIHSIPLTASQKKLLRSRQGGGAKYKELRWQQARIQAKELLSGPYRELVIIVAMLYWAEGHKQRDCHFTNSDGRMVTMYLFVLRRVFLIKNDAIHPILRIFTGMDEMECLIYWSQATGIPKEKFAVLLNDGGIRGRTTHGICRIVVRKGTQTLKLIHSLIDQIFKEVIR